VSQNRGTARVGSEVKSYRRHYTSKDVAPWAWAPTKPGKLGDTYVVDQTFCDIAVPYIDWINRAEVREAFKIPQVVQAWQMCIDQPQLRYTMDIKGVQDIYPTLFKRYRILIY
jgi:hypothetical protein